jgi:hypothetical protein
MKRKGDDTKKSKVFTAEEDDALLKAVLEDKQDREAEGDGEEEEDWDEISKVVPGKTPVQCLKRYMTLNQKQGGASESSAAASESKDDDSDSPKKSKRPKKDSEPSQKWSNDEIELLKKLVEQYKDSTYTLTTVFKYVLIA